MKECFWCKGTIRNNRTNFIIDKNDRFFIIKNVPYHKCSQCGETSYTGSIARRIEEIVAALEKSSVEVAIVDYQPEVA